MASCQRGLICKSILGELLKVDSTKVPTERAGRYFYLDRKADQDQYVLLMRATATAAPKVLVDPHPMAADHSTSVTLQDVSEDGKLVAYGIRKGGADEEEIHFLDPDTGKQLGDVLPAARYFGITIVPDKSGLYYDIMSAEGPRTRWHKFGADVKDDTEIFGKGLGPELITYSTINEDGRYLFITIIYGSSADKTEVYYLDRTSKDTEIKPLIKQVEGGPDMNARFIIAPAGDHVYVHTNWRSPNGRILDIDMKHPYRAAWNQIVDERQDAVIEDVKVSGGKIAVTYLKNVASEIKFFTPGWSTSGRGDVPDHRLRARFLRTVERQRSVLLLQLFPRAANHLPLQHCDQSQDRFRQDERSRQFRRLRTQAGLVQLQGRNQGSDVPPLQEGAEARRHRARVPHCLRWIQRLRTPLSFPRSPSPGRKTEASSPYPTFAEEASSARPGTRPACLRRSRMSSTT